MEDFEATLELLSMKDKEVEVYTAKNGKEALEKLGEANPCIIFCDYNMPKMDGHSFLKELKTNADYATYSTVPIIGTGSFPADKKEYLDDALSKPMWVEDMQEMIEKYCS